MSSAFEGSRLSGNHEDICKETQEGFTGRGLSLACGSTFMKGGFTDLDSTGGLVAISPHLDDAVLSCEALSKIARDVHVLTIIGGDAPFGAPVAESDRKLGIVSKRRITLSEGCTEFATEWQPRGACRGDHCAVRCHTSPLRGLKMSAFRVGPFPRALLAHLLAGRVRSPHRDAAKS